MLWARLSSFPRGDNYIDKATVYSRNAILFGKASNVDKRVICVTLEAMAQCRHKESVFA